jgi:hypothetical protein
MLELLLRAKAGVGAGGSVARDCAEATGGDPTDNKTDTHQGPLHDPTHDGNHPAIPG